MHKKEEQNNFILMIDNRRNYEQSKQGTEAVRRGIAIPLAFLIHSV